MSERAEMRMQRIDWLLKELQYEVTRRCMEDEIDEHIRYTFIIPVSRTHENGIVECRFACRPMHRSSASGRDLNTPPKLSLVDQ